MALKIVWRNPHPLITATEEQQGMEFDLVEVLRAPQDHTRNLEALPAEVAGSRRSDPCSRRERMLKIQRSTNGQVIFTLSGEMEEEHLVELERLIESETSGRRIVLDLKNLTLVGRDAVIFLEHCEADGIILENCAVYVREWITRQRRGG